MTEDDKLVLNFSTRVCCALERIAVAAEQIARAQAQMAKPVHATPMPLPPATAP